MTQPILEKGIADVAGAREDDRSCKPYLERLLVDAIDIKRKTEEQVVQQRKGGGGSETVVREYIYNPVRPTFDQIVRVAYKKSC